MGGGASGNDPATPPLDDEESRIFCSPHTFTVPENIALQTKNWVEKHRLVVGALSKLSVSDYQGTTCYALVQVGCMVDANIVTHEFPHVFSSKTKVVHFKHDSTNQKIFCCLAAYTQTYLKQKEEREEFVKLFKNYQGYTLKPVKNGLQPDFKIHLKKLYKGEDTVYGGLPETRSQAHLKNVEDKSYYFFA